MTGDELLFEACKNGQLKAVNGLIERILVIKLKPKANVNAKDRNGYTPLFYAARDGHKEIARTLLLNGADVNAKDKNGYTPLYHATKQGHKEIVRLLVARGAQLDTKGKLAKLVLIKGAGVRPIGRVDSALGANLLKVSKESAKSLASPAVPVAEKQQTPQSGASHEESSDIQLDQRLEHISDINVFVFDERDRLMSGKRRRDDSTAVVWDLLQEYKLFRGMVICDHIEKARAILSYATGESGALQDMVGEIGETPDGATLVFGGDLRKKTSCWLDLVELISKRQEELGVIEASFFDMVGETSVIIEKSPQRRLSNLGKALGNRSSKQID